MNDYHYLIRVRRGFQFLKTYKVSTRAHFAWQIKDVLIEFNAFILNS